jgi:hypothetical protein
MLLVRSRVPPCAMATRSAKPRGSVFEVALALDVLLGVVWGSAPFLTLGALGAAERPDVAA